MRKGKKFISAALGFALVFQSFAGIGPVAAAATGDVDINSTFTDANFRSYVSSNFDTNKDGKLSEEEIDAVTSINVSQAYPQINNMNGVDVFTSLTSLNCSKQSIKVLDITNLEKLVNVDASNNQLTEFKFPKNADNLVYVDISNNYIKNVVTYNDYPSLTGFNTASNNLEALDLSYMKNLTALNVSGNAIKTLDFSKNTKLESVFCQNMTGLEKLDLATKNGVDHTALREVECTFSANAQGTIGEIDVSGDTALESLQANNNSVSVLNIEGATAIRTLTMAGNKLNDIDVTRLPQLETLDLSSNNLSKVDVSKNTRLKTLTLTNIGLADIDVTANTALETLDLTYNQIGNIDVSKNLALVMLKLSDNQLKAIDLDKNVALEELELDNNNLVALDVHNCASLTKMSCAGNIREISLAKPDYIYDMGQLVTDGYKKNDEIERTDDYVGPGCVNELKKSKNDKGYTSFEPTAYTLYPGFDTDTVTYSYYYGKGKSTVDFTLKIVNPLKVTLWYTTDKGAVDSGMALNLKVGDSTTLTAKDDDGNVYDNITWGTSDPKVFTVNNKGELTCVAEGEASLFMNINGRTRGVAAVACHKPVSKITLTDKKGNIYQNGDKIKLESGTYVDDTLKSITLAANCYASDDTIVGSAYNTVTYTVTDSATSGGKTSKNVITCKNGLVTVVGGGKAYLHCVSNDSGVETVLEFEVIQHGNGITLSQNKLSLFAGDTKTVKATVYPDTTSDKTVEWSSDNEDIATVDENGMITAVAEGEAVITCTLKENGNVKNSLVVTVNASDVQLSLNYTEYELVLGSSAGNDNRVTLEATIEAEDPSLYAPVWSSSDPSVATVNTKTGQVMAKGPGEATITCSINGGRTAECKITVISKITRLTIKSEKNNVINADDKLQMIATITPENATDKSLEWSSSDESIASIGEDGLVTGHKKGTVAIICKTLDGSNRSATFTLRVNELATDISINKTDVVVYVGKTAEVTAKVLPDTASNTKLTWTALDSSIASVSNGRITGKAVGTTTVSCTTQDGTGLSKVIRVRVLQQIKTIMLDQTNLALNAGETYTLVPSITPQKPSNAKLNWSSDNTSIATVDAAGHVKAVGRGTTTIRCVAADGVGAIAQCRITVTQKVRSIIFSTKQLDLFVGGNATIGASVMPANANNNKVTWKSSNEKVASVSTTGNVTAIAAGSAVISCQAQDGSGVIATCTVKVTRPVQSIKLNQTQRTILKGKKYTLKATVGPKSATKKTVTWKSSNKKIATVNSKGIVTAKKAGRVVITCVAKDGSNVQASCSVTVANPVKTIKLNKKKATVKKKSTYQLTATVGPKSATNKAVSWKSSNNKVATVSANGLVTAKKKGKVTITVKAKDGSKKSAKCTITVK